MVTMRLRHICGLYQYFNVRMRYIATSPQCVTYGPKKSVCLRSLVGYRLGASTLEPPIGLGTSAGASLAGPGSLVPVVAYHRCLPVAHYYHVFPHVRVYSLAELLSFVVRALPDQYSHWVGMVSACQNALPDAS